MTNEFRDAAVELNSIFNNMSEETLNKIPKSFVQFFKEIASDTYKFEYDKTKPLNEQKLLPKTKGLIALIYRDFLCNEERKEEYIKEYNKVIELKEKEKAERYDPDKIFKEKTIKSNADNVLPVMKKTSFFRKIIDKIKEILNK